MTTGTKVFLALFAVIVGVLVVYYGVIVPKDNPTGDALAEDRVIAKDTSDTRQRSASQATTREAVGDNGVQQPPSRAAPPPRQPAAAAPQPEVAPASSSTSGGLLSEGIREATGEQAPVPRSMALAPGQGAMPLITNPLLPLVGLNGGDFTPANLRNPRHDNPAPPASVQPSKEPAATTAGSAASRRAAPEPVVAPQRTEYLIAAGDTFVSIAESWFGDESKWSLIARENPTVDPQRLKIGQRILLPPKSAATTAAPPEPVITAGEAIHIIESGETLIAIARETLGDSSRWQEIHRLNRATIGDDPAALKVGMKLRLPRKSS